MFTSCSAKNAHILTTKFSITENFVLNRHKEEIASSYISVINKSLESEDASKAFVENGVFGDVHIVVSGEFEIENKNFSINAVIPMTIFTDRSHILFLNDSSELIDTSLISVKQKDTEYLINAAKYEIKSDIDVEDRDSFVMKADPELLIEIYLYGKSAVGNDELKTKINITVPLELHKL